MKAALLSLAVLCVFGVQANVEVEPNFNVAKFAGKWHIPALASTDQTLQNLKNNMTTPAARVILLPNGNLELESYYLLGENCKRMKSAFMKTEQPGHFAASDENMEEELWVLATDNANFVILYIQRKGKDMPPSRSLQLYTRDPNPGENLGIFKKHCAKMELLDQLVVLPLSEKCFKELRKYGCLDIEMTCTKQENGMYIYKNEWGDKIIERVKTDCKSYIITGSGDLNAIDDKICKFVSLYAPHRSSCSQETPWAIVGPVSIAYCFGAAKINMNSTFQGILSMEKLAPDFDAHCQDYVCPHSVEQLFEELAMQMHVERHQIFYLAKKAACKENDQAPVPL